MKRKAIHTVCGLLLAAAMTLGMTAGPTLAEGENPAGDTAEAAVEVTENPTLENGRLRLDLDLSNGFFQVTDKATDMVYASNPVDYELDMVAQGVNITRMISQILVTYLDANRSIDEVNSFVGATSEGGLTAARRGDSLLVTYTFAEQGFVIPLEYRLTEDSLLVTIDYAHVQETGDCRVLNITLLPFFGAARQGDEGAFILPDGSGSYIGFNNGRFAQGEYRREIYGGDLTQVSTTKPNDYKPVLLPMFAGLYTHVTPPAQEPEEEPDETEETDETAEAEEDGETAAAPAGRDVQAGFLAAIREGAADSEVAVSVAGYDTGYNTANFTFLYRTNMETTLLSRTWAEIKRILYAEERSLPRNPQVEYRFLQGEQATIKGAADVYAAMLLAGETRGDSLNNALYLDIAAAVRTQQQFLGFGYQDITPLTTLDQTQSMLEELQAGGVEDFVVRLRGLDSSGAYYGKIDSKLAVDGKLGSVKQLAALTERWKNVFPEVQLTQFTSGGNGVYAFLHSVTAVNKKTAKLFDYHYATGLRDYDRPTRYLLRPANVEKAVQKLQTSLDKSGLTTLAPTSLGQDLYSNYGGENNSIGAVQDTFTGLLASLGEKNRLLLEAPNAYAMPYADALLYLPHTDSGHFVSNGAIPFVQMVLDGLRGYSVPAVNYAADPHVMLLHAVESNSALAYSVMGASYEEVARTSMNSLYASDYAQWKDAILAAEQELMQVREKTGGSAIADYAFLDKELRRVTFTNGAQLMVNYGAVSRTVDGTTVAAKSYVFVEGEGAQ